jgi:hypothetical protein
VLFVVVVLAHERRKVRHLAITEAPSASWTGQQIVNAFPFETPPKYLLRDRDGVYGANFVQRMRDLGPKRNYDAVRPRSGRQSQAYRRQVLVPPDWAGGGVHAIATNGRQDEQDLQDGSKYCSRGDCDASAESESLESLKTET